MGHWLAVWGRRLFGIFLCTASWLIAMGLYSLGRDWYFSTFAARGVEEWFLHGVVYLVGPKGGAVFFFLTGIFILWAFFASHDGENGGET